MKVLATRLPPHINRPIDGAGQTPCGLKQLPNLTLDEMERLAYISHDTKTLALLLQDCSMPDHILCGLDSHRNLTFDEGERLAYISRDARMLALLRQFEEDGLDIELGAFPVCNNAPLNAKAADVAHELYRLVCNSGGKRIDDHDDVEGLLVSGQR